MEKDIEKYDIFISSKSEDYALADKLYDYLTYNGYHVFFAKDTMFYSFF